jgi:hypothetical protein
MPAENEALPLVTDRELLAACFGAIAAVARELTGKRLVATFPREEGEAVVIGGSPRVELVTDGPVGEA